MKRTEMRLRLRRLFGLKQAEHDLHDEVEFHLAMAAHKGMRPEAAFGGSDRFIEECRDLRRLGWLEDGWRDLTLGLRRMRQAPVFSLVAVATLALGIGANAALFTVIDAVVLRPLPVPHPEQLVSLGDPGWTGTANGTDDHQVNGPTFHQYQLLRQDSPEFSGVMAEEAELPVLQVNWGASGAEAAEPVTSLLVSANYFSVLGVQPARGRFFDATDDIAAAAPDAVMSYAYWQSHFAGDDSILGRQLQIYSRAFTVIGVAPRGFFGAKVGQEPALYLPIELQAVLLPGNDLLHDPADETRVEWLNVVARRRPGVSVEEARAQSNAIFHTTVLEQAAVASAADRASILTQTLPVEAMTSGLSSVRGGAEQPLWVLFGLVVLILAIVVVNLGGMTSAQAAGRRREMEMRLSLGASRGRLLRQLLTESALLAAIGGVLGWALGAIGAELLLQLIGNDNPVQLVTDWRVLGFAVGVCIISALGFGMAPAVRLSRLQLGRSTRGGRLRLGRATVLAQVAVALVLVTAAALFTRSLGRLRHVDIGYNPHGLVRFRADVPQAGITQPELLALYRRLQTAMARLPGVEDATFSGNGLFLGNDSGDQLSVQGYTGPTPSANWDQVAPGYFATLGVPMLLGREFSPADDTRLPKPVIIDQITAQRYFAGRNPLGQQIVIHITYGDLITQIIGVSGIAQEESLRARPAPRLYLDSFNGDVAGGVSFILRARNHPNLGQVRTVARGISPSLDVRNLNTVDSYINQSISSDLTLAQLSGFFAVVALLLAAMGLYAMLSYAVSRRQAEIGVRMALGAEPAEIRGMFLRQAAGLLGLGLLVGVGGSLLAGRALASLLFQLNPMDVTSLAIAAAALAATALLAAWLPALRASRLDPVRTLRQE